MARLVCINVFPNLINGVVKYVRIKVLMSKRSERNILADVQRPSLLSVTVTFLKNPRKYLCCRAKKSLALQSPFLNPADLFHIIHAR